MYAESPIPEGFDSAGKKTDSFSKVCFASAGDRSTQTMKRPPRAPPFCSLKLQFVPDGWPRYAAGAALFSGAPKAWPSVFCTNCGVSNEQTSEGGSFAPAALA